MRTADVPRQENRQRHTQTPHQTNLEDAVILPKKNRHSHAAASQERENERSHQLANKILHKDVECKDIKCTRNQIPRKGNQ